MKSGSITLANKGGNIRGLPITLLDLPVKGSAGIPRTLKLESAA